MRGKWITVMIGVVILSTLSLGSVFAKEPTPGLLITKDNVDQYKEYLPSLTVDVIKKYNYTISVKEPTKITGSSKFKGYTEKYHKDVKLGSDGKLINYVAGLPFPNIDPSDPKAGLKVAWNYTYHNLGDDVFAEEIWYFYDKNAKLEKTVEVNYSQIFYHNRTVIPPIPNITPNPDRIFFRQGIRVTKPYDSAGIGFIDTRYSPNEPGTYDDMVAYIPAVRRLRRMVSTQVYDAFLGSDLIVEDFWGYYGSVLRSKWKFIKKTKVLALMDAPDWGPNKGWFPDPDKCKFELVDAYLVESYPQDPNHPYSKREHYIDAENFYTLWMTSFDKKGKPWRQWMSYLRYDPGSGAMALPGVSVYDVQREHCTVIPIKFTFNKGLKVRDLEPNKYLREGIQ